MRSYWHSSVGCTGSAGSLPSLIGGATSTGIGRGAGAGPDEHASIATTSHRTPRSTHETASRSTRRLYHPRVHVLVRGAGIFGVTTALALRARGIDVTLVDPGPVPHPLAESTDISKVVRI